MKAQLNTAAFGTIIGYATTTCTTTSAYSGDIAEIIMFNRRLNDDETANVNAYLAIKYGITLDQVVTGQDYLLSGDITAWSWLSGGIYNKDIAGIGRHDASLLYQITGQSTNSTGDMMVSLTSGSFDVNNEFLTWANDGGATGTLLYGDASNVAS